MAGIGVGIVQAEEGLNDGKPFADTHIIMQVSDADPVHYQAVLDISNNLTKGYGQEMIDIEIIAFGAGVPMAPSTEIHPAVATTPFPGIGANQGTAQVYGSNDATKYEDPHPPPGSPPAWHHQSSVENPQYQQTNTFVKPADPETEIPQFTMPQRLRLRRRR